MTIELGKGSLESRKSMRCWREKNMSSSVLAAREFHMIDLRLIHVSPEAKGGGDGSEANPMTLAEAIQAVQPGEVLELEKGLYDGGTQGCIGRDC